MSLRRALATEWKGKEWKGKGKGKEEEGEPGGEGTPFFVPPTAGRDVPLWGMGSSFSLATKEGEDFANRTAARGWWTRRQVT